MFKCWSLFCLVAALLFTVDAQAQVGAHVELGDSVEELNARCPISYRTDWSVNSFTMVGDRYVLVDVEVPSGLSMVFPMLTEDADNVKQMWAKQLELFGNQWKRFVGMMVEHDRRVILHLHPQGKKDSALITFFPSDFKRAPEAVTDGNDS